MKRRSYIVNKAGSLNNLEKEEGTLPPKNPGEVTIRIHAIGLNFADIFAIKGLYSATPKGNFTPGLEFAGDVIETDDNNTFNKGDKVMGVTRFGAYTNYINHEPQYLRKLPNGWDYDDGAAFPVQALTAYYALIPLGDIQNGQTVLINSAAGGVGIWANRIAKLFDAFTIGTVGNESKFKILEDEGYNKYFARAKNYKEQLLEVLSERKLNLALDSIGGRILQDSYDVLASTGRVITYGSAQFTQQNKRPNYLKLLSLYLQRPRFDPMKMVTDNKSIMAFNLIWLYQEMDLLKKTFDGLINLNLERPLIGHRFSFEEMKEALLEFQTGNTVGKVVVTVESD